MRVIARIVSLLPFPLLYLLSDFLYFVLYYIVGYRKVVIKHNLQLAFPKKTSAEIKDLTKKFYKNLSDTGVEVLKAYRLSGKEFEERISITNQEEILQFYKQNKAVLVMTSHQCNWEWLLLSCSYKLPYAVDAVYQKLKNKASDDFFLALRSKFGARLIEKKQSIKHLLSTSGELKIIAMVSDQSPQKVTKISFKPRF